LSNLHIAVILIGVGTNQTVGRLELRRTEERGKRQRAGLGGGS